ncbi:MAG: sulfite exporter TauE/SafE family protein [Acidobacteria bacterium]|nr:sulfite exporter TauE/SafE family protein [Acidobacteriota bacterium]
MAELGSYLILLVAGFIAGTLNVVAGGGSFLTLPVLIFLGLPATVANGTNRVAVLTQNVGAVWSFHQHGVMDWRTSLRSAALPAMIGAWLGAELALLIGDEAFKDTLAFLMVAVTLWTLWDPLKGKLGSSAQRPWWVIAAAFFVVGVYSGFVQAGVGFLILAATTLSGLDLVRGNAVKVMVILATMVVSLWIFASEGKVDWLLGFVLGAGNLAGGLVGVRLTVLKGHGWIKKVVTATVILFALRLWFFE